MCEWVVFLKLNLKPQTWNTKQEPKTTNKNHCYKQSCLTVVSGQNIPIFTSWACDKVCLGFLIFLDISSSDATDTPITSGDVYLWFLLEHFWKGWNKFWCLKFVVRILLGFPRNRLKSLWSIFYLVSVNSTFNETGPQ